MKSNTNVAANQTAETSTTKLLRECVKKWEQDKGATGKLLNLETMIANSQSLGRYQNALLRDESDRLYLVYATRMLDDNGKRVWLVGDGTGLRVPLSAVREGHLEPCSVQDACEWFSTCCDFMDSWDGEASELCGMAAKEIERLTAIKA